MNRPPLELADLARAAGRIFIERSRQWITWQHLTVPRAIARCRTAALGGHLDECIDCGYRPVSTKGGRDMDLFDRFAGNDSWHTRRLLEYADTLTEEQLDRPLPTVIELLPWREANKTLRQLLENIIFTKEVWTAALSGAKLGMNGPSKSQRSPEAMLQRLDKTDAELHRIFSGIRNRSAWDDTFVDALCEPAET